MKRLDGLDGVRGDILTPTNQAIISSADNLIKRNLELCAALRTARITIDKPFVLVAGDAHEICDHRPLKVVVDKQLQQEQDNLLAVAQRHGEDVNEFSRRMTQFQARVSDAREAVATYGQIRRLLEPPVGSSVATSKERATLARQILMQAAEPDTICQGHHNTCTVASLESVVYSKHPSKAAEMLVDLALSGQFTAPDGAVLKLDPHPRDYIQRFDLTSAHERTYASELFQLAIVNLYYLNTGFSYQQRQLAGAFKGDTGEDLFQDGKRVGNSPSLYPTAYREMENSVTGADDPDPRLDNLSHFHTAEQIGRDAVANGARFFRTEEQFEQHLRELQQSHGFPVILTVHTANDPFVADSPDRVGDPGGWHAITVHGYIPGHPAKVCIDNPWGEKFSHHEPATAVPVHELYLATFAPAQAADLLQKDVASATAKGRVDEFSRFESIRLNWVVDRIGPATFVDQIVHQVDRFKDDLDAKRLEKGNALRAVNRLDDIVANVPKSMALRIQEEEYCKGLLPEKDFVSVVTDFGIASHRKLRPANFAQCIDAASDWLALQEALASLPRNIQQAIDKEIADPRHYN